MWFFLGINNIQINIKESNMDLDYFKLYLRGYMSDHGSEKTEISSDFVSRRADEASNTFSNFRRHGYTVYAAEEAAIQDMMRGVGLSRREVVTAILLKNFKNRVELKDADFMEFWVDRFSNQSGIFDGFEEESGIGLSEALVENSREILVSRFDQYLITNGL